MFEWYTLLSWISNKYTYTHTYVFSVYIFFYFFLTSVFLQILEALEAASLIGTIRSHLFFHMPSLLWDASRANGTGTVQPELGLLGFIKPQEVPLATVGVNENVSWVEKLVRGGEHPHRQTGN